MGTTTKQRAMMAAAKNRHAQNNIIGLGAIGELTGGIFKGLDIGGITPGIIDLKLASGILAARSMGYSDQQMRQEPVYSVIASVGSYAKPIKEVVANAPTIFKSLAQNVRLPQPELNAYPYKPLSGGTAAGGPTSAAIIRPIFGDGIADLSATRQTITSLPPASAPGITEPVSARIQDETQRRSQSAPQQTSLNLLVPLIPVMDSGLRAVGKVPPVGLENKAEAFYESVVIPAQGESFSLDENIIEGIIAFVGSIANKKAQGETLPPVYDKIGEIALKVEGQIATQAQRTVDTSIGSFITSNWGVIIGGLALLAAAVWFFRKK